MKVNKLAGLCLILFGVINVLHEIFLRTNGIRQPGFGYAMVTALLFAAGAALFGRQSIKETSKGVEADERTSLSLRQ